MQENLLLSAIFVLLMTNAMTLAETLFANGYTHRRVGVGYAHEVCHGRKRVFVGTAAEVWDWLEMLEQCAAGETR